MGDRVRPIWEQDKKVRVGYLALDNTSPSDKVLRLKTRHQTVLVDYDEDGFVIGIEVLW